MPEWLDSDFCAVIAAIISCVVAYCVWLTTRGASEAGAMALYFDAAKRLGQTMDDFQRQYKEKKLNSTAAGAISGEGATEKECQAELAEWRQTWKPIYQRAFDAYFDAMEYVCAQHRYFIFGRQPFEAIMWDPVSKACEDSEFRQSAKQYGEVPTECGNWPYIWWAYQKMKKHKSKKLL